MCNHDSFFWPNSNPGHVYYIMFEFAFGVNKIYSYATNHKPPLHIYTVIFCLLQPGPLASL